MTRQTATTLTTTAPTAQYHALIQIADLLRLMKTAGDFIIFDTRHDLMNIHWGAEQYAISHLPNARFAGLDSHLSAPKFGVGTPQFTGRHPLPDRAAFRAWLASQGVGDDTQVIVYDQGDGMYAARLWWMCRWAGVATVAVLDGGFAAWCGQGLDVTLDVTTDLPSIAAADYTLKPALETVYKVDAVQALIEGKADKADKATPLRIIDARAPERYRGEVEPLDRVAGHIPGAKNRFFKGNVAQGVFKQADVLQAEWLQMCGDNKVHETAQQLIHTCGSGATACHNILALHVAGLVKTTEPSILYAGSWSEWSADPCRAIELG